jgi:hypothetical protein
MTITRRDRPPTAGSLYPDAGVHPPLEHAPRKEERIGHHAVARALDFRADVHEQRARLHLGERLGRAHAVDPRARLPEQVVDRLAPLAAHERMIAPRSRSWRG